MPPPDLIRIYITPLEEAGISYMVTGAIASIAYGEPRLTHDIDLVIEMKPDQIQAITNMFPSDEFYCPPAEVIKVETCRFLRGHFNLIQHSTGMKAYLYLTGEDKLHSWGMSKRKRFPIEGKQIWFAPPEYVIVRKLQYYREGGSQKHLSDIVSILKISGDQLDMSEIEAKVQEYGLGRQWQEALKKAKIVS
jgi:hypothetical protein